MILRTVVLIVFAAAAWAQAGRVLVLDDFETPAGKMQWSPAAESASPPSSHGARAARFTFRRGAAELRATGFPAAWRGFDRLLFDIHCTHEGIRNLTVRIHDREGAASSDYFEARSKIAVLKGWNHVEVQLPGMQAASWDRAIELDKVRQITLAAERVPLPWTVHIDNVRLAAGPEPADTASRTNPQDTLSIIRNRFFEFRQVARQEDVPESAAVRQLRAKAVRELERFRDAVQAARQIGRAHV